MVEAITEGIKVSVESSFREFDSSYEKQVFIFTYQITISNHTSFPVQLLKRHWKITDSNGEIAEVIGDGVIGEQPTILPGSSHTYNSFCHLKTDLGTMEGKYLMERKNSHGLFEVTIPKFHLEVPFKAN